MSMGQPNMGRQGMGQNGMDQPSISSMGGGTPITQLRRDVPYAQPTQSMQSTQYKSDKMEDDETNTMKFIIDEINNDSDIGPKKKKKIERKETETETDTESEEEKVIKKPKKKKTSKMLSIPELLKDSVLIWLIYMLMSQNFFKKLVGKYLTTINPNEEGVVSFTGVAMYGLILVTFYTIIKFIFTQLKKY
jgi:hypothetical protein